MLQELRLWHHGADIQDSYERFKRWRCVYGCKHVDLGGAVQHQALPYEREQTKNSFFDPLQSTGREVMGHLQGVGNYIPFERLPLRVRLKPTTPV